MRCIGFQSAGRARCGGRQTGIQVGLPAAAEKRPSRHVLAGFQHLGQRVDEVAVHDGRPQHRTASIRHPPCVAMARPTRVAKLLAQFGVGHAFVNQCMEVAVGCPAAQTAQCAPAGLERFEDFVVKDIFIGHARIVTVRGGVVKEDVCAGEIRSLRPARSVATTAPRAHAALARRLARRARATPFRRRCAPASPLARRHLPFASPSPHRFARESSSM